MLSSYSKQIENQNFAGIPAKLDCKSNLSHVYMIVEYKWIRKQGNVKYEQKFLGLIKPPPL